MSATPIRFVFRGALHQVSDVASTTTVLEWLRLQVRAMGTKEGCNEGDCGACTVVIGELDVDAPGGVSLRAINACIHLLAMLDGKALFTVEDLAAADAPLHPVQQAMVDCHGAQCGFCTPGFVMSLYSLYENRQQPPDHGEICHALAGNLCRCTGYKPIIAAALLAWQQPSQRLDRSGVHAQLQAIAQRPDLDYQAPANVGAGRVQAPATLAGLAQALDAAPKACILAGATDIGLWINKQGRHLPHLIHLDRVPELQAITQSADGALQIGAAVTHTRAWAALVAQVPALADLARRFAAPTVCNAGTLGGNVANGSPIGDAMPALLALDATLLLQQGAGTREVALADFYLGYQRSVLQPGEFLRSIHVPALPTSMSMPTSIPSAAGAAQSADLPVQAAGLHVQVASYKVSKRADQDITAVCAAFRIELQEGRIVQARVAFGGMAATPVRARQCEAVLGGAAFTADTLRAAQQALHAELTPMSDLRASAAYRQQVAANLLARFWLEVQQTLGGAPDNDGRAVRLDQVEASA